MKNKLLVMGLAAVFAMTGMTSAQNLLSNGDMELDNGSDPLVAASWTTWGGWWMNREVNGAYPGSVAENDHHLAIGAAGGYGAGAHQDISVADDGATYQLRVDAMLDAWWLNSGYLKLEFFDASTNLIGFAESTHFSQPNYDVGLPLQMYYLNAVAPAGTEIVRPILGTYGEGGTARFDNAVLEVVPEPATLGLLGLSGLALWIVRRRR